MRKNRRKLRIVTLFLILMFLLVPLLSSPVSAVVTFKIGAYTINSPTGPLVGPMLTWPYETPGYYTYADDPSGILTMKALQFKNYPLVDFVIIIQVGVF